MTDHIVNSLNPRSPASDNILETLHRDPGPDDVPLPDEPPMPGEPPVPSDPPVVPPSPVAAPATGPKFEQPAGNRIMPSDDPTRGLNSYMDE
jgi:hypothetical protein